MLTPKLDFENGVLEPDHHREFRTQNTLVEIDMSYGLTDRLALGDEVQANAGFRFRTQRLVTWSLQVNGRKADRDEFLGDGFSSTGSTLVNLTPGMGSRPRPARRFTASSRSPCARK